MNLSDLIVSLKNFGFLMDAEGNRFGLTL